MADRFPSLEDLDEGQTNANEGNFSIINDSSDATDFLQRERAALGDDADFFRSPQDDIPTVSVQYGDNDLIGSKNKADEASEDEMLFQSSYPAIDTRNERVAPGGTITGSTSPFLPGIPSSTRPYSSSPSATSGPPAEEPEVIKEWRERRSLAIQHREDAAMQRKTSTVKAAQEAVDEFYDNYNNKKEKTIAATRKDAETFLEKREDTAAGGTSWERIVKLVDIKNGKVPTTAGGKEKFRELLLSLSKDDKAPGAKGY